MRGIIRQSSFRKLCLPSGTWVAYLCTSIFFFFFCYCISRQQQQNKFFHIDICYHFTAFQQIMISCRSSVHCGRNEDRVYMAVVAICHLCCDSSDSVSKYVSLFFLPLIYLCTIFMESTQTTTYTSGRFKKSQSPHCGFVHEPQVSTNLIWQLQLTENVAARVLTRQHSTSLHFLDLYSGGRIDFKISPFLGLDGLGPKHLSDLLLCYEPPRPLRLAG